MSRPLVSDFPLADPHTRPPATDTHASPPVSTINRWSCLSCSWTSTAPAHVTQFWHRCRPDGIRRKLVTLPSIIEDDVGDRREADRMGWFESRYPALSRHREGTADHEAGREVVRLVGGTKPVPPPNLPAFQSRTQRKRRVCGGPLTSAQHRKANQTMELMTEKRMWGLGLDMRRVGLSPESRIPVGGRRASLPGPVPDRTLLEVPVGGRWPDVPAVDPSWTGHSGFVFSRGKS